MNTFSRYSQTIIHLNMFHALLYLETKQPIKIKQK